ncbi:hypothetical protein EDC04DRAFT_2835444 [Pisolithus marmoratus]|nr:hypothetical protein EDC04DRAFT_2835444 [Pisolithus marmoratus]
MPPATLPTCDVSRRGHARKYRLARNGMKGACGMDHLKDLERQMTSSPTYSWSLVWRLGEECLCDLLIFGIPWRYH